MLLKRKTKQSEVRILTHELYMCVCEFAKSSLQAKNP